MPAWGTPGRPPPDLRSASPSAPRQKKAGPSLESPVERNRIRLWNTSSGAATPDEVVLSMGRHRSLWCLLAARLLTAHRHRWRPSTRLTRASGPRSTPASLNCRFRRLSSPPVRVTGVRSRFLHFRFRSTRCAPLSTQLDRPHHCASSTAPPGLAPQLALASCGHRSCSQLSVSTPHPTRCCCRSSPLRMPPALATQSPLLCLHSGPAYRQPHRCRITSASLLLPPATASIAFNSTRWSASTRSRVLGTSASLRCYPASGFVDGSCQPELNITSATLRHTPRLPLDHGAAPGHTHETDTTRSGGWTLHVHMRCQLSRNDQSGGATAGGHPLPRSREHQRATESRGTGGEPVVHIPSISGTPRRALDF